MTFVELLLKTVPQAFVCVCFVFEHAVVTVEEKIAVFVVCSYSMVPVGDFNAVKSYRSIIILC